MSQTVPFLLKICQQACREEWGYYNAKPANCVLVISGLQLRKAFPLFLIKLNIYDLNTITTAYNVLV